MGDTRLFTRETKGEQSKMTKNETYKEFKKWVDDKVNMAEAMGLDENSAVLPDMVEQNIQAWVQIQEMLEEYSLHYRAKGKKKRGEQHGNK